MNNNNNNNNNNKVNKKGKWVIGGGGGGGLVSPAVGEEAAVGVSGAVTPGRGAGGALRLEGLPGEGCSVQEPLLLPPRRQRAAIGAAVCGILPADVAQAVTAGDRAPSNHSATYHHGGIGIVTSL